MIDVLVNTSINANVIKFQSLNLMTLPGVISTTKANSNKEYLVTNILIILRGYTLDDFEKRKYREGDQLIVKVLDDFL